MTIITWSGDVLGRYPHLNKVNSAVNPSSAYIYPAHIRVEGYMGRYYTTPFSSNNETAKDLLIDMTYLIAGNLKLEDAKTFREQLKERMDALNKGDAAMITTSGDLLATIGGTVWSSTQDYHPTFGVGDVEDFRVDSGRMYDEEQARV